MRMLCAHVALRIRGATARVVVAHDDGAKIDDFAFLIR